MRRIHLASVRSAAIYLVAGALLAQAPEYSVQPRFEQDRPIDRVLARVDAQQDVWVGEQDFEAINTELKSVAQGLKDGKGFKPLEPYLARFTQITLVEFKIVSSQRSDASADTANLRLRVELGGKTSDGTLLSLLGSMDTDWRRAGNAWTLEKYTASEMREVKAERFYFTEITDGALGHIPSFRAQLSRDVDDWRATLDAAVGVSVYGHNGLSLGDYDGDGLDDLYVSQPAGLPNLLYRNRGDGTFDDVTAEANLGVLDDTSMSLFADLDSDGDQDLVLISSHPLLFRNDGQGRFRYDPQSGLTPSEDRAAMMTGAALADYDNDGDLDLYVCSYDFWQSGATYDSPTPYYDAVNGPPNLLFRNDGSGGFEEVTTAAGLDAGNNRFSFAAAWGDYDDDGDADLYVANDFGRNNLYRNQGDGTFVDVAAEAGVEDIAAGMAASWADYDNDGDLDLHVSNMWSSAGQRLTANSQFQLVAGNESVQSNLQRHARGNSLFRNRGDGTFADVSLESGITMGRWAWSSDFVDFDNDGFEDLYVSNGYISGERLDDL